MTEKKYTAPYTARQIYHAKVGNTFFDQGVKMRITRVGDPYIDVDHKPAFDSWAVPVVDKETVTERDIRSDALEGQQ